MPGGEERRRDTLLPPGARVGDRYAIEAPLAAGDMGAVYRATDGASGARVALKVLRAEYAQDEALRRRFRREATVLGSFEHPNVVRVLDAGVDVRGSLYLAMELLAGETLRARLDRERRLGAATLSPVVLATASALDAAHGHGVFHGDLTPSNVFLLADGSLKLVDFGLAKILGLERLTATGEVIGTPHYMAPELLTGRREPDGRIDVYAMGVILYECLAGVLPFSARNLGKLIHEIVRGGAVGLHERGVGISERLADVVARAMSVAPEARPATPGALADAWREALAAG